MPIVKVPESSRSKIFENPEVSSFKGEHSHCGEQACPALGGEAAPHSDDSVSQV
ncbi:hypothetical protein IFT48_18700 [Pseudomonas fluorescens]|uniref:hypothetical protein n=1 Tax=Pseudomonas fluorescens TaxID=294 RepID=UPI001930BBD1|nr:hypothetical protein [Pseudomonas fluorescens]MBD8092024.1 hypothetical protein [Pseudomonas fluorescens]MBD8092025.1 hypothetical protein [Pseudomonas fluorescens]MBD8092026.1 hypothetical protein [Pseudomonas fluorescens]